MSRLLPAAAFAVLAASGCAHFECVADGGKQVRELRTEHFVVTSDLPAGEHRTETVRLELLWDTFAAFFGADVSRATIPVVVLGDSSDVGYFSPDYAGMVVRSDPEVLVVSSKSAAIDVNVSAHELTHLVSAFLMPRQPRWVAEGLGTYFEDAKFIDDKHVRMGRWNATRAQTAFYLGVRGFDALMAWDATHGSQEEAALYASAWAWIHYLANHEPERLEKLFAGLRGTRPLAEVMTGVFPPADAERLRAAVSNYVVEARFRGWSTRLSRDPHVSEPRVLRPWEVHLLRARMMLRGKAAVERELRRAVALSPRPWPAEIALAEARLGNKPVAPLVDQYPRSAEVIAAALFEHARVSKAQLDAALIRAPTDPVLLSAAARHALDEQRSDDAVKLARQGLAVAPWSTRLHGLLFYALLQRGSCDEAGAQFAEIEASVSSEGTGDEHEAALRSMQQDLLRCAAKSLSAPTTPAK